jgi:hypothetical protein
MDEHPTADLDRLAEEIAEAASPAAISLLTAHHRNSPA